MVELLQFPTLGSAVTAVSINSTSLLSLNNTNPDDADGQDSDAVDHFLLLLSSWLSC